MARMVLSAHLLSFQKIKIGYICQQDLQWGRPELWWQQERWLLEAHLELAPQNVSLTFEPYPFLHLLDVWRRVGWGLQTLQCFWAEYEVVWAPLKHTADLCLAETHTSFDPSCPRQWVHPWWTLQQEVRESSSWPLGPRPLPTTPSLPPCLPAPTPKQTMFHVGTWRGHSNHILHPFKMFPVNRHDGICL